MQFKSKNDATIFQPQFVMNLFDEMAATYGLINVLSSFGFCMLWRKQCVAHIDRWPDGGKIYDLMSGMGELWPDLMKRTDSRTSLVAVDLSHQMCLQAIAQSERLSRSIDVLEVDVLGGSLPDVSADVIVSSFGLKTFSPEQQLQLASTVVRVLKPGGTFSFLEISLPASPILRWPFLIYLRHAIPFIGRLFLGNPDCYRMLSIYTETFRNAATFKSACETVGLRANYATHFFGCASVVCGSKSEA